MKITELVLRIGIEKKMEQHAATSVLVMLMNINEFKPRIGKDQKGNVESHYYYSEVYEKQCIKAGDR